MKKGKLRLQEPSNRNLHILEALREGYSMAEVGRVYGVTRQYVFQVKARWPEFIPKRKPLKKTK
jgi:hypothetical protein